MFFPELVKPDLGWASVVPCRSSDRVFSRGVFHYGGRCPRACRLSFRVRSRSDRLAPQESARLSLSRQADFARHVRRALRRRSEPGLRLQEISRGACESKIQSDADVRGRLSRNPRVVQHPKQHACAQTRPLPIAVGANRGGEVRPRYVRPSLLRATPDLPHGSEHARNRGRARSLLPDVRTSAMGRKPHERKEQYQRNRPLFA